VQVPPAQRPTVSAPRRRLAVKTGRPGEPPRTRPRRLLAWIKRESLALLAMSGAALTVMAELGKSMPLAPQFSDALARWQHLTEAVWRPPIELTGFTFHPDIIAALNVSAFMALLGAGARISARFSSTPLAPMSFGRFFDDQTWPSLLIFAALCLVFLLGHGASPDNALTLWGSPEIGKYAFAVTVTAGYFLGDFIGHRDFHVRLYRLVVLVLILVAANFALIYAPEMLGTRAPR
jgi:hypothetical protein